MTLPVPVAVAGREMVTKLLLMKAVTWVPEWMSGVPGIPNPETGLPRNTAKGLKSPAPTWVLRFWVSDSTVTAPIVRRVVAWVVVAAWDIVTALALVKAVMVVPTGIPVPPVTVMPTINALNALGAMPVEVSVKLPNVWATAVRPTPAVTGSEMVSKLELVLLTTVVPAVMPAVALVTA